MDDWRIFGKTIDRLKADKQYNELQAADEASLINNFEYYRGKSLKTHNYNSINDLNCNKEAYLMLLLPHLIDFCHYIYKTTDANQKILFKSRDCYFIKKLFDALYAGARVTEYVYMSRKACYTNSNHFKDYIDPLTDNKTTCGLTYKAAVTRTFTSLKVIMDMSRSVYFFEEYTAARQSFYTRLSRI